MKKFLFVLAFAATVFGLVFAAPKESPFEAFEKKAAIAEKDIQSSEANLRKIQKEYDIAEKNVAAIKAGGKPSFFDSLRLKYYLNKGNSLGYKIYRLEAGIRELKEEHFTYISVLSELYGARLKSCCEKKCGEEAALFGKWAAAAAAAEKYADFLRIDMSSFGIIRNHSPRAASDAAEYIQKKIVQAEQRIYLLSEAKGVINAAKKAGLDVSSFADTEIKIAELKKLKAKLEKEKERISAFMKAS